MEESQRTDRPRVPVKALYRCHQSLMKLKHSQRTSSHVTLYDLLGKDETGLSKAFAYVLANNRNALFAFLRFLGINARNATAKFRAVSIETERNRDEGRTDIEICHPTSFHVIVECKVHKGKILHQRKQYLSCFRDVPCRVMCFITQDRDTNKQKHDGIIMRHLSWMDVLDVFEGARLQTNVMVRQFMMYATRTYKMKTQREVLVQDLSNPKELERYLQYSVYRRDVTFGSPLYFAPYFTRNVDQAIGEGIRYLSRVLGVLTMKPCDIEEYRTELEAFAERPEQVEKWTQGVSQGDWAHEKGEYTFYFLDEPVELPTPLAKERSIKKGRGKNWIAGMIPKNRCVTFAEMVHRMTTAS